MIEAQNLRKAFGNLTAVDGVSFAVGPGEIFGLLGPNGAGKTTTLHLLCGLLAPDEGTVRGVTKREIGLAPQEIALYDDLSGLGNLRFFGALYGAPASRCGEVLRFVGLQDRARDRVRTYSGGMKRRLNLAVALLHDPPVLLLDEPTVGVDPQSRNFIFDNILELKKRGKAILYTTHYMEEAERLCDRVAIMDRGRIVAMDTVPGLLQRAGNVHVVRATLGGDGPARVRDEMTGAGYACTVRGQTLFVEATRPDQCVSKLIQVAGEALQNIEIRRPSLEAVFLHLTGRELRDD